ncbi:MAG: SAM-dependent methyltransferase [Proteobacteria bacterium]|nr:MAG: SAM-dependent methyltransferase [Pseudomonadota bacterium]
MAPAHTFDDHLARGRFERALALADAAAAADPADPGAHHRRALALERLARLDEAGDACLAALDLDGDHLGALLTLGAIHARRGQRMSALERLRRAAALTPERAAIAKLVAASGGAGFDAPLRAEVSDLFDAYADTFDAHLVGTLGYRGHLALPAALAEGAPDAPGWLVIDLGCGTGLCGPALRPLADRLVGVDVAPKMVAAAAARGVYDATYAADLVYALATQPRDSVDLYVAADVLGYLGDLEAAFAEAARSLRRGGRFGFTVEATEAYPWRLGPSRRAAYAPRYLRELAASQGLTVTRLDAVQLRREGDEAVGALLVVLDKK